jgi:hypothetical protein
MENIMPQDRPNLTPQTLDAFMQRVHAEPALKAQIIDAINTKGFADMVGDFFSLTDRQRANLVAHNSSNENMRLAVSNGVIAALETNGKISLNNTQTNIQGFSASGHFGNDGVDVSIECSL